MKINMRSIQLASVLLPALAFQGCLKNAAEADSNSLSASASVQCGTSHYFNVVQSSGLARDIAVGPNSVWVIGTVPNGQGWRIYKQNTSGWQDFGGGASRIAMKGDEPIVLNNIGEIYYLNGTWVKYPANDYGTPVFDVGAIPGYVYQIRAVGNSTYPAVFDGTAWTSYPDAYTHRATQISGHGSSNDRWIVNKGGTDANPIWELRAIRGNGSWGVVATWPTEITDVAGAGGGVAYMTVRDGYKTVMYRYAAGCVEPVMNNSANPKVQIVASRLSARDDNSIWYVNDDRKIFNATR